MKNSNLNKAKKEANNEFYTQLPDIEKELVNYKDHFKDKVIYCNCDSEESNFVKYFKANRDTLKYKRLIYTGIGNGGKFEDNIDLLKQCDIVVTNPPFSIFRDFISLMMEYDKKFLVIGSMNAITYKEIFKHIKNNKLWLGVSIHSGDREFGVPNNYPLLASGVRVDENGNKFIRVKGVRWFTNLEHNKKNEKLILYKEYNEKDYPKYDNYEAIEVSKVKDIPINYKGIMGVPITFLDKYNQSQFDILGCNRGVNQDVNGIYGKSSYINGKETFKRLFIKNK
jgi:hypothetical protein